MTSGTSGGNPVTAIRAQMIATAAVEIAAQYQTRSRGKGPMDWSIVGFIGRFGGRGETRQGHGPSVLSVETETTSTAGEQQCYKSTASGGDTDSNLLHRNSPLRLTSAAAAMGGGAHPLRSGFCCLS